MTEDLSRDIASRQRQERWEHHMHGLCILDNHLNVEMEIASHRSSVLNHLVEQANRVKDLWLEFQRKSDNGCVLEDTAVQMAIEQHGLQSHHFHQPQLQDIQVCLLLLDNISYSYLFKKFILILDNFTTSE